MDTKLCDQCNETVEAAKAFCPACGNSFVAEETREKVSEFEASAGTVQYSESMFNQLLSDMELNISEAPDSTEKVRIQPLSPAAPDPRQNEPAGPKSGPRKKWFLIASIALALVAFVAVVLVIAGFILYLNFDRLKPYLG